MRRTFLGAQCFLAFLFLAPPVYCSVALELSSARIADEDIPVSGSLAAVEWSLNAPQDVWGPGAGVKRVETGQALGLHVSPNGGELIGSGIATSATRFGRIRLNLKTIPTSSRSATLTWTRADGSVSVSPVTFAADADDKSSSMYLEFDMEKDLRWYGLLNKVAIRLPGTLHDAPYEILSVAFLPRQQTFTTARDVRIVSPQYAIEVSPHQARRDSFVLVPQSTLRFAPSRSIQPIELRFGLGIIEPAGAPSIGGFSKSFLTQLEVEVRSSQSGRVVAAHTTPVLVSSPRWVDVRVPFKSGLTSDLRVTFTFRDDLKTSVVALSNPRLVSEDEKGRLVFLVVIDALRKKNLSMYGYERPTPGIDMVGKDGLIFDRAFSQSNETLTAMASVMTSRYPHRLERSDVGRYDSLAGTLAKAGFLTAAIVANPALSEPAATPDFSLLTFVSPQTAHSTSEVTDRVIETLRMFGGEDLFLYIHYIDPHAPYLPPIHVAGTYSRRPFDRNVEPWVFGNVMKLLEPGANPRPLAAPEELPPPMIRDMLDAYDEEILDVSIHLDDLWTELKRSGSYLNALVVLTADHGEEFYEHKGVLHAGAALYNEVISVPLAVKFPRWAPRNLPFRGRSQAIVQHVDILPTILEVCGVAAPSGVDGETLLGPKRGYSLSEWNTGGATPLRRRAFYDGEFKLITSETTPPQPGVRPFPPLLFRIPADAGEEHDLAVQMPEVVRELEAKLRRAIESH